MVRRAHYAPADQGTVLLRCTFAPIPLKTVLAVRGRTSGTDGLLPYDLLQKH